MSPFWSRDKTNKTRLERIGSVANAEQGDAMIIEQLQKLGADLTKPRIVHHYIYLPKSAEVAATKMVEQYGSAGYGTSLAKSKDGKWSVRLSHVVVVPSDDFQEQQASFKRVATALGGEYDGWEASTNDWQAPTSN